MEGEIIFNIDIMWYAILITTGMVLAVMISCKRAPRHDLNADKVLDFVIICIPAAIIGARLYYVLTSLDEYDTLYEMIAIWNGGIAIYGAVIAGVIAFTLVVRYKKKPLFKMYDVACVGLILGQSIGRWGNFFNAEAYGIAQSFDFFGKKIDIAHFSTVNPLRMTIDGTLVHPTFLYESLWNFAGFVLMNVFYKKRAFDGEVFLWYLSWYGLGRCMIEGLRGDSLYIGNIRISQLVALVCFVVGVVIIVCVRAMKSKKRKENENGSNN